MGNIFTLLLTQPLFNALVTLYKHVTFEDLGFAIIILTILIRIVLYPVFYKGLKNQAIIQKMQPELKEVQKKHKNNKEEQAKALMALYKKNKVNPFSSMFYLLVQLPIIFAVYRIFLRGLTEDAFKLLYPFISVPENINHFFLGSVDLTKPSMAIVALAVVAQYIQSRLSIRKTKTTAPMAKYMVYLAPLITLLILPSLSSAIGLYWLTTAIFSIFQQRIINKKIYGNDTRENPAAS